MGNSETSSLLPNTQNKPYGKKEERKGEANEGSSSTNEPKIPKPTKHEPKFPEPTKLTIHCIAERKARSFAVNISPGCSVKLDVMTSRTASVIVKQAPQAPRCPKRGLEDVEDVGDESSRGRYSKRRRPSIPEGPLYTLANGETVYLPKLMTDMLNSTWCQPKSRLSFSSLKNVRVGDQVETESLGQCPIGFGTGIQGLLVTEQMMELWEEMKKETGLGFAKCLTGPKGVGKSYITWFLAAKAYAHGWPVLYIAGANTLADCQENVRASRVICQRFLDLNKDILTAKELSTMANCGSVEAIAEYILGDLLQQQGKKTLFIVDEHGALFPDNVPSATSRLPVLRSLGCFNTWTSGVNSGACVVFTSTAKFERSVLRNSDYVVDVGPLSQDTFEKLFKIAIARFTLTTQRTLDSRNDAVIKITNRVPGDLTSLDQLIQGRHI
ncbi:hypothetical protein BCR41DRAFT_424533 [Lobosporangium transversale]|uniref:Uncharacterized protein n=1 Tax=Lobosporangium transversale TaxID=64571 RepID=A0A1Y2GF61_9FUNG|nr:hypothetical protein BCR41DRAFT_424533 [Lobosporangium transversale]ORZ08229.1 hypothetical protein BCR41DRAFT_424533 [Lobosporangium transversale]|eukprot:XP_021878312.1 hypothetical protein BCR41DRAFT_424533 [Lobosporangium transversale]